ncbi:mucin-19-like [Paramacrobiotus metropolitanus]|uniref:mucin-19-like n=1 Tax=Paramacrobiotus metropolitanus TaxID=2943436 RepID=UPI0024459FCF|nr:mucin-19-like [Paramacrobiotus metropolitanus]
MASARISRFLLIWKFLVFYPGSNARQTLVGYMLQIGNSPSRFIPLSGGNYDANPYQAVIAPYFNGGAGYSDTVTPVPYYNPTLHPERYTKAPPFSQDYGPSYSMAPIPPPYLPPILPAGGRPYVPLPGAYYNPSSVAYVPPVANGPVVAPPAVPVYNPIPPGSNPGIPVYGGPSVGPNPVVPVYGNPVGSVLQPAGSGSITYIPSNAPVSGTPSANAYNNPTGPVGTPGVPVYSGPAPGTNPVVPVYSNPAATVTQPAGSGSITYIPSNAASSGTPSANGYNNPTGAVGTPGAVIPVYANAPPAGNNYATAGAPVAYPSTPVNTGPISNPPPISGSVTYIPSNAVPSNGNSPGTGATGMYNAPPGAISPASNYTSSPGTSTGGGYSNAPPPSSSSPNTVSGSITYIPSAAATGTPSASGGVYGTPGSNANPYTPSPSPPAGSTNGYSSGSSSSAYGTSNSPVNAPSGTNYIPTSGGPVGNGYTAGSGSSPTSGYGTGSSTSYTSPTGNANPPGTSITYIPSAAAPLSATSLAELYYGTPTGLSAGQAYNNPPATSAVIDYMNPLGAVVATYAPPTAPAYIAPSGVSAGSSGPGSITYIPSAAAGTSGGVAGSGNYGTPSGENGYASSSPSPGDLSGGANYASVSSGNSYGASLGSSNNSSIVPGSADYGTSGSASGSSAAVASAINNVVSSKPVMEFHGYLKFT